MQPGTEDLWLESLEGLPEKVQSGMKQKGFEECKTVLPFTRYVMQRNDEGLSEFVERNIGNNDHRVSEKRPS